MPKNAGLVSKWSVVLIGQFTQQMCMRASRPYKLTQLSLNISSAGIFGQIVSLVDRKDTKTDVCLYTSIFVQRDVDTPCSRLSNTSALCEDTDTSIATHNLICNCSASGISPLHRRSYRTRKHQPCKEAQRKQVPPQ